MGSPETAIGERLDKVAPAGRPVRALFCTPEIPEPERQSGSRRIYHNLQFLIEAGAEVTLVSQSVRSDQDRLRLEQLGVPVFALSDLRDTLLTQRPDLVLIAFWELAEYCIPIVRELAPGAPVIVDSIDLDFVRTARRLGAGSIEEARRLDTGFGLQMERELDVYAESDRVLTVSEKEKALVEDRLDDASVSCVPDFEHFPESLVPLAERRGIVFVGNFRHPPNGEALEFLCREIVPRLDPRSLASHRVVVIGNALEGEPLDLCWETEGVEPVGFVPSLTPYLATARVFVAPLLSGAGTKRKLIQALMVGVPAVATTVAAEGLELVDGEGVAIADHPAAFAALVDDLAGDDQLWERVAGLGRGRILDGHDREPVLASFVEAVKQTLRAEPGNGYREEAGEESVNAMKRAWDRRARADAMHYIASARTDWKEADFFRSGEEMVRQSVTADLPEICRGAEPARMRMLEIGCGIGRMTRYLAPIFAEVHAIDVSGEMIQKAREKLADLPNVHLYETGGSDLDPFEPGFFDFAYSYIVFQHIPDKEAIVSYFREVHRTLKPDRLFKFQVQGQPIAQTDTWTGVGFTEVELDSLAAEIGFVPLRTVGAGTQYCWNWWVRA